jgi:hypothetical protein
VPALVKRGRKVSFGEAWRSLKLSSVGTYAIWCMNLLKGNQDNEGMSDTAHML